MFGTGVEVCAALALADCGSPELTANSVLGSKGTKQKGEFQTKQDFLKPEKVTGERCLNLVESDGPTEGCQIRKCKTEIIREDHKRAFKRG